jgi:hypothetical protein
MQAGAGRVKAALVVAGALVAGACVPAPGGKEPPAVARIDDDAAARSRTGELRDAEDRAIGWMAAADPRLAARANATAPADVLAQVGTEAVLAEDVTARIRGGSLDLFAFRARARALAQAARVLDAVGDVLPEDGPAGSGIARPRLERELLSRLVASEVARADDEAGLVECAGDLVRGILTTWTAPATPQDVPDRDAWIGKHLLEIRDALRDPRPLVGPRDLDVPLYPLERLLAPAEFPRAAAAIAQLRTSLDDDRRVVPKLVAPARVAQLSRVHLGVQVDAEAMPARLERLERRLRDAAQAELAGADEGARGAALQRARQLLFVERPCPSVPDSRVRDMAPPPERAAICGALRALAEEPSHAAAVVALHDDVLLAFAAVAPAPPPRTGLLCRPEDDDVDALEREARERPVVVLGVALAAEILYGSGAPDRRVAAWRALGEAPLDVVARELGGAGRVR